MNGPVEIPDELDMRLFKAFLGYASFDTITIGENPPEEDVSISYESLRKIATLGKMDLDFVKEQFKLFATVWKNRGALSEEPTPPSAVPKQNYVSDELTHFVGRHDKGNEEAQFEKLVKIIASGQLTPSPNAP